MNDSQFDAGLAMRRQVMGEDFVANAHMIPDQFKPKALINAFGLKEMEKLQTPSTIEVLALRELQKKRSVLISS